MTPSHPPRTTQRGAALLTAMIIVTLIASLAAGMVWQQFRSVQLEAADRARAQSTWILQGALDWARLILKEDAQANRSKKAIDYLGEPWATPLAEARLSTFLAADRTAASADDGPEAFLSGSIEDAQSHYNLRALISGQQVPADEKKTLEQLCATVNAPPGTSDILIAGLRAAFPTAASAAAAASSAANTTGNTTTTATTATTGTAADNVTAAITTSAPDTGPLQPAGLDELAWFGLDVDTLARLRPYVTLLPKATPVNLNTAPREVIAAVFNVDLATAERMVQGRKGKPLESIADAAAYLPAATQLSGSRVSVESSFFVVTGRLRLEERQLEQRSLIERQGLTMVVLARERVSQILDDTR